MRRASTILLFLLISLSSVSSTPDDHEWLLDASCNLISIFDGRFSRDYCTSVLKSSPFEDNAKLSLHGLAWVSLNVLRANITATQAKLETLSSPENAIKHCTSMYKEASHRAADALKYMEEKAYTDADRTVSMIQGDGSECETAFVSEPGIVSPLTKENLDTQYLSAITTLLIRFFDRSYTPWGVPVLKTPVPALSF